MRKSLPLSLFALLTCLAVHASADELFSRVEIESVFQPSSSAPNVGSPVTGRRDLPRRVMGPATLAEMLNMAGFETKEVATQVIAIKVERNKWSIPVLVTLGENQNELRMVMLLSVAKDDQAVSTEKLMKLLDANRESTTTFFAYSQKRRRTELHRVLPNQDVSSSKLRDELNGLAEVAASTESIWSLDDASSDQPAPSSDSAGTTPAANQQTATAPPQPASRPAESAAKLVGKWAAARSDKEAFALQINADGTFALVTVQNGKTSQSQGKFTLNGSRLTLNATEGAPVAGTVKSTSADEFQFVPAGSAAASAGLTFKRAR